MRFREPPAPQELVEFILQKNHPTPSTSVLQAIGLLSMLGNSPQEQEVVSGQHK